MSHVDRLIGDPGHGLTPAQRAAFALVAAGKLRRDEMGLRPGRGWMAGTGRTVPLVTIRALMRLGLIERGERVRGERYSVWQLTPDGHTLALHMGLLPAPGVDPQRQGGGGRR